MADGGSQGYDAIFEPEVDKRYTCPVCLAVLRDAVQTHCGHRFCEVCITNVIGNRQAARCPVDNTWFYPSNQLFEDIAIRREILSFTVKCSYHDDGCLWKADLRDFEDHIAECIYRPVECTHNCGESILYLNLFEHLEVCPRRPTNCPHCEDNIIHVDMTKHQLLFCRKFPVSCALCSKSGILRENIASHVDAKSGDCPNTTVFCSFLTVGCHFMDRRGLMSNHYAENLEEHVSLLLFSGMNMDKQIEAGKTAFQLLQEEMKQLQLVILAQKNTIEEQSKSISLLRTENRTGCIHWKVPVPDSDRGQVVSPSFYTGVPGYKVHLTLNFNRPGLIEYSFIRCYLEAGEFDNDMLFPFQATCKVTLCSQAQPVSDRANQIYSFECHTVGPVSSSTEEPDATTPAVACSSNEKFVRTSVLVSHQYKQHGYVYLKVEVCT